MKFLYLRDPLFLFCLALYGLNRWLLKPPLPYGFLHSYLNDVICIPFWVPIMLWLMRLCHSRLDDAPPQGHEIIVPLIVWSAVFELLVPNIEFFRRLSRSDPFDVLAYTVGACFAALFWNWWYERDAHKKGLPMPQRN